MARVVEYIKDTKSEMKHVSWPSRQQVGIFTALVVGASLATAVFLGFFDYVFSTALSMVLPEAPAAPMEQATTTGTKSLDVQATQEVPPAPKPGGGLDFDVQ